jgi:hypothetical protein
LEGYKKIDGKISAGQATCEFKEPLTGFLIFAPLERPFFMLIQNNIL